LIWAYAGESHDDSEPLRSVITDSWIPDTGSPALETGPSIPNGPAAARRTASTGPCRFTPTWKTDLTNRAITLYEFFDANMRAGPGRLDLLADEVDEVAAVSDAHRVVA
jgi:hypothetical protein